ncbi:MAG: nitrogen fixation protein NifX [Zoogloeaceae bacterium]|jgi:nitrogen fixation protein NifX|nr:nitrogen fixation protein NifX [Zoogloeaceae bacterium]
MLKLAFASDNRARVNLHFGSATAFVVYEIGPDKTALSGFAEFPEETMDGNENKLAARMEALADCDAVFVRAIGASAIQQLLAKGVQPIRVGETDDIAELLREVRAALRENGGKGRVPWIERALTTKAKANDSDRFARMESEGWEG